MMVKAAIGTYQFKVKDRATRLKRTASQSSLDSLASQLSEHSFNTAETEWEHQLPPPPTEENGISTLPPQTTKIIMTNTTIQTRRMHSRFKDFKVVKCVKKSEP